MNKISITYNVDDWKNKLIALQGKGDTEAQHGAADDILCAILKDLGLGEIVDEWEKIDRWYA